MPTTKSRFKWCLLLAILSLASCDDAQEEEISSRDRDSGIHSRQRSLDDILESGRLVVVTRNAPTTWYIDQHDQPAGPEYELVESFAAALGVEVDYRLESTVGDILGRLEQNTGDLAAAGLTITPERRQQFRFGPAYMDVTQQVVCRRDRVQPEEIEELIGLDISVIGDSSYSETLQHLKDTGYPELEWTQLENISTEQLLYEVWQGAIDCTVADSSIVDINRRYYPELIAPLNLRREEQLGWVMPKGAKKLANAVDKWMTEYRRSGQLATWYEKYFGYFEKFDYVDIRAYIRRIDKRFPKYSQYFREAAEKYDLPFTLLAAQGYQESHWDPHAKSPTGVRGIMMLTQNTARAMDVKNRLDPKQSISGGARYLARMRQRFREEVTEPDLTWLSLAAYNVGRGHMHDAQVLARQKDLSPYHWKDIKQVLPLLADKRYYRKLKYGYARGMEPVRYVGRIREYQHILEGESVGQQP
ncbi:MAG: membrane-bound lytic murein transglycosylase MltF [Gammaproteobacteria bacterium]|nr:membrane-bound lytic murein transglycosylase MltF [Gammaproteobacteria bacterium]